MAGLLHNDGTMTQQQPLDPATAAADNSSASTFSFPASQGRAAGPEARASDAKAGAGQASPVQGADGYAGDVSPQTAWQWVEEGTAVLIDVRTDAEREWVGFVPGAVPVALKQWPGMAVSTDFDSELESLGQLGKKLVMLCRSGVRSIAAARRATELGMEAYNILEGFEGDPDGSGHRNVTGGWRRAGLPWKQN